MAINRMMKARKEQLGRTKPGCAESEQMNQKQSASGCAESERMKQKQSASGYAESEQVKGRILHRTRDNRKTRLSLAALGLLCVVLVCCLPTSCVENGARITQDTAQIEAQNTASPSLTQVGRFTDEYLSYLALRSAGNPSKPLQSTFDGYQVTLENGSLCIVGTENEEIWRSKEEWYVDSFQIGDVNCDRIMDVAFVVWKSFRFGTHHPDRHANDDATVRCHLFVYSVKDNRVKSLWCSSSLPRPIYSFELNTEGKQTAVLSGVRLITREGIYTEDYSETAATDFTYEWSGWGFTPIMSLDTTPAGAVAEESAVSHATLAVVGDLMCHTAQWRDALQRGGGTWYDFDYSFNYVAKHIAAADYAIGNLETTIALPGNNPSDFPRFGAPAEFAEAIKSAGFDLVTTANNHALDFGKKGLFHTLQVLDNLGLAHTGTYASDDDSEKITVIDVNGITFALLSYTHSTNGFPVPQDAPWCINQTDGIRGNIARAKALDPDVIIVFPHMGIEYETTTRQQFKDEVYELLEAGADVVLASHPHVLQPVEFIQIVDADGTERNCFAAYSLGNFISSQLTAPRDYGMIVNLGFKKNDSGKTTLESVDLLPVWVKFPAQLDSGDIAVLPVNDLDKPGFSEVVDTLSPQDAKRLEEINAEFGAMYSDTLAAWSIRGPSE